MAIIKGEIKKKILKTDYGREFEYITVEFSVDELCKGNTPATNFWTFCLLNDLIEQRFPDEALEPGEDPEYRSKIDTIILDDSEDDEKNRRVREIFDNYDIFTL